MVGEVAATAGQDDDIAFFEVLQGAEIGRRHLFPDDRDSMSIGGASANECAVTGMPSENFASGRM